jgi:prepilin peptidase CpaA
MNPWSGVLLVPLGIAVVCDLRTREVPDWIPLAIVAWACVATALGLHKVSWGGLVAGAVLGLGLSAAVCRLGGLGEGDVTLLTAIGAAVGPWTLLSILAWMALAGGILALIAAARRKRDFAYVPAIAVGVLVETVWPGGLARVLLR